jgi:hypothetical protein
MTKRNQQVVPFGAGWAVKSSGLMKVTAITSRKADAITIAKGIAQENRCLLTIYGRDGKVRTKTNYAKA